MTTVIALRYLRKAWKWARKNWKASGVILVAMIGFWFTYCRPPGPDKLKESVKIEKAESSDAAIAVDEGTVKITLRKKAGDEWVSEEFPHPHDWDLPLGKEDWVVAEVEVKGKGLKLRNKKSATTLVEAERKEAKPAKRKFSKGCIYGILAGVVVGVAGALLL
jgi:hypothetical protein